MAYSSVLALSMFSPLLAVIISKSDMKKIGWKPNIKKNIRWIMCAWFIQLVLGVMGAALYFLLFPSAWDTSFLYIRSTLGTDGISQLENSGISVPLYAGISVIAAITYAPFVNMFFAVGEEAGWRGTMYPILKEHFGITKGRLVAELSGAYGIGRSCFLPGMSMERPIGALQ